MSRVEELLAKYNPNGINDIPLWELTAWDKRFNAVDKSMQKKVVKYKYYLAKDLDELVDDIGDIRILYTNERVAYTSEEKCKDNICEGEIVAIPWGGTPTVKYYKGKFVTGDNRIATSLDTNRLNNKYLYYWMISQLGIISDYYRGAGIQHPSMLSVLSMQIPLPHIKVQEEIVKILDSFTNLIDALNEELSLRQKQFEYYREKLLTFDGRKIKVEDFCLLKAGKAINAKELSEKCDEMHPYACYGGNGIRGYIGKSSHGGTYPIIGRQGALCGCVSLVSGLFYATEHAVVVTAKKGYDSKFLYYLFKNANLNQYKSNGAQPGLAVSNLNLLEFSIPPLAIQQSIVEKLDAFESLISSLKEEIALRQKQYEYYREKLLTFE